MSVARCAAMTGFAATSNVEAARRYGLRATGTMAHSFIEAFPTEADAFRAFAEDFPDRTTFLVDTYDTMQGVRTAIDVIRELGLTGAIGIRLDSGDMVSLAARSRSVLDAEGLPQVRIFASGGLDEYAIAELVTAGAPIDAFGVGTRMGVSADAPYLDSAYKLVEYDGRPVMKLSPAKVTAPGRKQVFRGADLSEDVIGIRDEAIPDGCRPLLEPVMGEGRRTGDPDVVTEARARFEGDVARLPQSARAIDKPVAPLVRTSPALKELGTRAEARIREGRSDADRTRQ